MSSKNTSVVLWFIHVSIGLIVSPGISSPRVVAHLDEEHRQPVEPALHLVDRRGAGEQHHHVRVQRPRRPDLLAVDAPRVAVALGTGADRRGLRTGGGLGDAERLQPLAAVGHLREDRALLLLRSVPQHRAHHVHLGVAGARVAARRRDLLQDHRRAGEVQPAAAVLLGDQRAEPALCVSSATNSFGVAVGLERTPVLVAVLVAQPAHLGADQHRGRRRSGSQAWWMSYVIGHRSLPEALGTQGVGGSDAALVQVVFHRPAGASARRRR